MPLFDPLAAAHARDRARRRAPSFLDERIWDEIGERLAQLAVRPTRALLLGPDTEPARRSLAAHHLSATTDPDAADDVDLLLIVRWAESAEDLPPRLAALAHLLPPAIPVLGCAIGGQSVAALRAALIEADQPTGRIAPRSHPRLDPAALAGLLGDAGFERAVVDVDRVEVRYSSLQRLIEDLRDLGATNQLADRPRRSPGKAWAARLEAAFPPGTTERFDLVHFSAWTGSR